MDRTSHNPSWEELNDMAALAETKRKKTSQFAANEAAVADALQDLAERVDGPIITKARQELLASVDPADLLEQVLNTARAAGHEIELAPEWQDMAIHTSIDPNASWQHATTWTATTPALQVTGEYFDKPIISTET